MDDLYKLRGLLAELSHAVPRSDRYEMLRYLIGMAELEVSDLSAPLRPHYRKLLNQVEVSQPALTDGQSLG